MPAPARLPAAARLPTPSPLFALAAIAICHGAYVLLAGVMVAPDTGIYDFWAQRLIDSGFDYAAITAEASTRFPAVLYLLFVTFVALLKLLFGAAWATALVAINLAADAVLGALLVRLVGRTTASPLAGWVALGLYLGCFGIAQWVRFALSDTTFCLLAFLIFSLAAERVLGDARRWGGVALLAVVGVFYRPTGLVLLPDLGWAAYLSRRGSPRIGRTAALLVLAALILGAAAAFAWFMQDPGRWPFDTLSATFRYVAADYALGEVVSARSETYHSPPSALLDYMLISADRFLHFFAPGAAGFSAGHWAAELVFFIPCYALALWLLVALCGGRTAFGDREQRVFLAAAGAILAYAVFHGLVQVDFDWRYRLPILPHLILLAAGGAADIRGIRASASSHRAVRRAIGRR
ncbi:hypothetical protein [Allosphingosinicella sp.]|jgi:hypothetical protein|uniref:hypothetical protein n=1 Tax=Allosphingosinicella sp. TaxID=2823234 RepID=UPI002EDD22AF